MKKRGFFILTDTMGYIVASIILCCIGAGLGSYTIRNAITDSIKQECVVIDRALENYAGYHKTVDESTIVYLDDGRPKYSYLRTYPENLTELGELKNAGFLSYKIDLTKFAYATARGKTEYVLEVELPDGTIYKSTGSK